MNVPTGTLVTSAGHGELAQVRVDTPVACARCAAGRGCGAGIFARERAGEIINARVLADGIAPGTSVDILIEDGALWRAAMLGYGYPLAGALVGGLTGTAWGDTGAAAGALAGIGIGLVASRIRLRQTSEPVPAVRPSA